MKTANVFTLTRVVLSPVFALVYFVPIWTGKMATSSAVILIPLLACMEITDYFDGHYARRMHEVSDFGKLFDPFADVMVHITTFACFMSSYSLVIGHYMPVFLYLLIVYRELTMNFLRMVAAHKGVAIGARKGGKVKTVCYVAAGFVCLVPECAARYVAAIPETGGVIRTVFENHVAWQTAAVVMFSLCVVLCYASFVDYLVHFRGVFSE